jgi:hypothetical protein
MAQGERRQADADAFCALLSRVSLSDNVAKADVVPPGVTIINLKAAKALDFNVPLLLQQRADEVIE